MILLAYIINARYECREREKEFYEKLHEPATSILIQHK